MAERRYKWFPVHTLSLPVGLSTIGVHTVTKNKMDEVPEIHIGELVKLTSRDGGVFYLELPYAEMSGFIRGALRSSSIESSTKEFSFPEISGRALEKVVEYFHYKSKFQELVSAGTLLKEKVPQFEVEPDLALEVLAASIYLQC